MCQPLVVHRMFLRQCAIPRSVVGLLYLFKKDVQRSRWLQKLRRALKLLEGNIALKGSVEAILNF